MADILLAEDNPSDVYLIREAFREHNVECRIRVASDGREALDIINGTEAGCDLASISLIILDLNLPRHDGIEILQHLRDLVAFRHVPVVVLTSSDSPRDRVQAIQLGAARYLRKPSNLDEFLSLGSVFKDLLARAEASIRTI